MSSNSPESRFSIVSTKSPTGTLSPLILNSGAPPYAPPERTKRKHKNHNATNSQTVIISRQDTVKSDFVYYSSVFSTSHPLLAITILTRGIDYFVIV